MKCGYCGKQTKGTAEYCSAYCREKGEAGKNFARKTRVPFWIVQIIAIVGAAVGIMLMAVGKHDPGAMFFSAGLALSGIGLLAFPRAGKGRAALSQVFGGFFFALAVAVFLLWR